MNWKDKVNKLEEELKGLKNNLYLLLMISTVLRDKGYWSVDDLKNAVGNIEEMKKKLAEEHKQAITLPKS